MPEHTHAQDPEPATDSAKNTVAGPGLTRQSHDHSERETMVSEHDRKTPDMASLVVALLRDMPQPGAPAAERATWLLRKADVYEQIAGEGGPDAAKAAAMARKAAADGLALAREAGES